MTIQKGGQDVISGTINLNVPSIVKNIKVSASYFELSVALFSSSFWSFKRGHSSIKLGQEVYEIKKFILENINNSNFLANWWTHHLIRPFEALYGGEDKWNEHLSTLCKQLLCSFNCQCCYIGFSLSRGQKNLWCGLTYFIKTVLRMAWKSIRPEVAVRW